MTETQTNVVLVPFMKEVAEKFGTKHEEKQITAGSNEILELIELSKYFPIREIPAQSKYLTKYTKVQIAKLYENILIGNVEVPKLENQKRKTPFSLEEDAVILIFMRLFPKLPISNIIQEFPGIFPIYRSIAEIKSRLYELKMLPNEQLNQIYDKFSKEIAYEKFFGLSCPSEPVNIDEKDAAVNRFIQCRCNYQPFVHQQLSDESKQELAELQSTSELHWQSQFTPNDLAILRSEKLVFYMRREAIMIGRGTLDFDVDVNLSEFGERSCVHISRHQAVITFRPDFNFYITNIGNRIFRVNGVIIQPGKTCRLHDDYLLDFSGILFIFYSNKQLIEDIKMEVDCFMEDPTNEKKSSDSDD